MAGFTLNILGTASAKPTAGRNPSSSVLDVQGRLFMIDCGEAAQMRLCRMGLSPLKIEAVFLTHLHGDHVFGIFGLLSTMEMLGRVKPLRIFAPEGFGEVLAFFKANFSAGDLYPIEFTPLRMTGSEMILETGTVEAYAFPLRHRIPTFGFLFRERERELNVRKEAIARYGLTVPEIKLLKAGHDVVRAAEGGTAAVCGEAAGAGERVAGDGSAEGTPGGCRTVIRVGEATYMPPKPRSYAYCSDTAPFPELSRWVAGVDLLYHEATFPKDMAELAELTFHSTTVQAAACARAAGAGRLVVGHYSSRFADVGFFLDELRSVFPNSFLADDGDVFEI